MERSGQLLVVLLVLACSGAFCAVVQWAELNEAQVKSFFCVLFELQFQELDLGFFSVHLRPIWSSMATWMSPVIRSTPTTWRRSSKLLGNLKGPQNESENCSEYFFSKSPNTKNLSQVWMLAYRIVLLMLIPTLWKDYTLFINAEYWMHLLWWIHYSLCRCTTSRPSVKSPSDRSLIVYLFICFCFQGLPKGEWIAC